MSIYSLAGREERRNNSNAQGAERRAMTLTPGRSQGQPKRYDRMKGDSKKASLPFEFPRAEKIKQPKGSQWQNEHRLWRGRALTAGIISVHAPFHIPVHKIYPSSISIIIHCPLSGYSYTGLNYTDANEGIIIQGESQAPVLRLELKAVLTYTLERRCLLYSVPLLDDG